MDSDVGSGLPESSVVAPPREFWDHPPEHLQHFRIEKKPDGSLFELGRGGMGVTYKAVDERLRLVVALKVISPARMHDGPAQSLFLREARAAARVRHSNVASVLYLNDAPGQFFYAMEFVAGDSVGDWLKRREKVDPLLAIDLGIQIARGLGAIHAEGIIHRDLKPTNIMLVSVPRPTPRRGVPIRPSAEPPTEQWLAKIIDFGLARPIVRSEEDSQSIGFRGTVLYASPEQCEEHPDLDGRSDLYSVGCILFQMLTGGPPFTARSHRELMNLHVTRPAPIERLGHLPCSLAAIVARLLLKSPDERFTDAEALVKALDQSRGKIALGKDNAPKEFKDTKFGQNGSRRLIGRILVGLLILLCVYTAGTHFLPRSFSDRSKAVIDHVPDSPRAGASQPSIAVLLFAAKGGAGEGLALGIQDSLIRTLGGVRSLRVIARSSLASVAKSANRDPKSIAAILGVDTVLEGRLQSDEKSVSVFVELVRPVTDETLWADSFEAEIGDLGKIDRLIAERIASGLRLKLSSTEKASLESGRRIKADAAALFSKAKLLLNASANSRKEMEEALAILEAAVVHDPDFCDAYALMSLTHTLMYHFGRDRTDHRLGLAFRALTSARRIKSDSVETLIAAGNYYYRGLANFDLAREAFTRVLASAPNNVEALSELGLMDRRAGNWESAIKMLSEAGRLDPLEVGIHYNIANTLLMMRQHAAARKHVDAAIRRIGPHWLLTFVRGELEISWHGDISFAVEEIISRGPGIPTLEAYIYDSVRVCLLQGRIEEALRVVEASTFSVADGQLIYCTRDMLIAEILTQADREREAKVHWERALAEIEPLLISRANDARIRLAHAFALAGTERLDEGFLEACAVRRLLPIRVDAFDGAHFLEGVAIVQSRCGRIEAAKESVAALRETPSRVTEAFMRVTPAWAPLLAEFSSTTPKK